MNLSFAKDVLKLTSGTGLAQLLMIGVLPILTRLYSPSDFGALSLFVAISSVFSVIATLKFDAAIMLPASERHAADLVWLVIIVAASTSGLLLLVALVAREPIAVALGYPGIENWLLVVPLGVFLTGTFHGLIYWAMRRERFADVGKSVVLKAASNVGTATTMGAVKMPGLPGTGLIVGQIMGYLVSVLAIGWGVARQDRALIKRPQPKRLIVLARKYFRLGGTLTVSHAAAAWYIKIPLFIIGALSNAAAIGFFGLADRVTQAPMSLISKAVGDVYRQRATVQYRESSRFDDLMRQTLLRTVLIGAPIYLLGVFLAPTVFGLLFGADWIEAGQYASVMLVGGFFAFIATPVDKAPIIRHDYRYIFVWHMTFLASHVLIGGITLWFGLEVLTYLWLAAALRGVMHTFDIAYGYRLAKGKPMIGGAATT
ncbi:MAG: oligosaccharide flippase family protein [Pseudomonadota bacterium]